MKHYMKRQNHKHWLPCSKKGAENDLVITKNTSSATDSTGFSVAKVNSEGRSKNLIEMML